MSATATDKTAQDVLTHLKETHTGSARVKMVQDFIAANAGCTAAEVVEWMISAEIPLGTLMKAGRFVHGDTWQLHTPGLTAQTELASLQRENAELRDQVRQLSAKNAAITNSNMELVRRNAVLSELDTPKKISRLEKRTPAMATVE